MYGVGGKDSFQFGLRQFSFGGVFVAVEMGITVAAGFGAGSKYNDNAWLCIASCGCLTSTSPARSICSIACSSLPFGAK